jgi:hypothetical protein
MVKRIKGKSRKVYFPIALIGCFCTDTIFMMKGPAADATDAPQSWGLLCKPVMKMIIFSFIFCNGAPVKWNWQGNTEVLGGKRVPVPICPP